MPETFPLYPVNRQHLGVLSDEIGIMQHATGSRPDPAHGYCTDDVARALQVDLLHSAELGWEAVSASARRNLEFLDEALDRRTGRFRNFRLADASWIAEAGSEDCHGRALLALGEAMARAPDGGFAAVAGRLFAEALPAATRLSAMRARASVVLACDAALSVRPEAATARTHRLLAGRLWATFAFRPTSTWRWPQPRLTYENALPARALLVAGRSLDSQPMIDAGVEVLDWLIEIQTEPAGHLSPVGNAWWSCDGEKSRFDQQPIEATALLLAAEAAYQLTGARIHRAAIERAYAWFLGANDLGVLVADPERGASFDGLTPFGVNANQGAESTLMWLIALEHARAVGKKVSDASGRPDATMSPAPA